MAKLIYIADDMAPIRLLIQAALTAAGYVVHSFASGNGLIRAAAKITPDLVITDIEMPNGNGYEVIAALSDSVPVIAISGAQPGEMGRIKPTMVRIATAKQRGAVAIVEKSADFRPLIAAVAAALA